MAQNGGMTSQPEPELVRTVLLVEDSDPCAATMEMALMGIPGVSIQRVPTGMEALRLLRQPGAVHAVVTDLNMPFMDGFELIRRIREDGRIASVPIMVVSADTDAGTPERLAEMRVDAFFGKPFSPAQVRQKLEQLLDGTTD